MSRILILDDEPAILKALQRLFRAVPCQCGTQVFTLEVCAFSHPETALEAVHSDDFDLILSDYRMPGMDGVEFLKATRGYQPDAARLILSGYADLNALVRAVNEVGIDRFIGKPWNDYELVSAIAQSLANRALQQENRRLANLIRLEMGDTDAETLAREALERSTPGITKVEWGPDGSVLLSPDETP